MAANYHFEHHRREALLSSRRFALANAILVAALSIIGGYVYFTGSRAAVSVSGHVALGGTSLQGASIDTCNGVVQSDANGNWSISLNSNVGFCARVTVPYIAASGPTTNNNPDCQNGSGPCGPGKSRYEYQVSDRNCYHNSTCQSVNNIESAYYWDRSVNSGYDFNFSPTNITITGNLHDSRTNQPIRGVGITTCTSAAPVTDTNGNFSFVLQTGNGFCVRGNVPAGYTITSSGAVGGATYEYQVAGIDCPQDPGCGNPQKTYDRSFAGQTIESGYNLTYASPAPPTPTPSPPPGPSPSPSPSPSPNPNPTPEPGIPPVVNPGNSTPSPPPAPPDTQPPTTAGNFGVTPGNLAMNLNWDAASDNVGVTGYALDRSIDRVTWTTIDGAITDTKYSDTQTVFSTHYYYRLRAFDAAGNKSDYVLADAVSNGFSSNVTASNDTTVTSDDRVVALSIPSGAVQNDTQCAVNVNTTNSSSSVKGKQIVVGPYDIICKDSSGNNVASFTKTVTVTLALSKQAMGGYTDFVGGTYDQSAWSLAKSSLNKAHTAVSFDTNAPATVAVLGSRQVSPWPLILTILFLLAIIGGVLVLAVRHNKAQEYNEYIRHKYYDL